MLVVLSLCHRDSALALSNAEWIASLGGSAEHKWIVACNQIAGNTDIPQRIVDALKAKYAQVELLVHYDEEERPWPRAQNHAFQRSAQYVANKYDCPWLWLECDAIPLKDGWLDALEAEYIRCGQKFMGMLVNVTTVQGQSIPTHMSGVAIYPGNLPGHSVNIMRCGGIAFDMAGAEEVLPQAYFTNLIQHKYQAPSITRDEEFNAWVPKEAVLFHQQKTPQLIEYLRAKRDGKPTLNLHAEYQEIMAKVGITGSCDIFIKTWPRDYDWLEWCITSITKFARGFRNIIVLSPEPPTGIYPNVKWVVEPDREPGYLWQQVCKLNADQHSDADYILFMDSDCVFTRPVTPDNFIRGGKVVWGHKAFREDEKRVWAPVLEKWMNEPATRSFMSGHPFTFPRWLFSELRNYCRGMHRQELSDYVMGKADPKHLLTFSEFNCAGAWAYKYARDKFVWEDRDHEPPDGVWVHQGFTHGGEERKQQDIAEFKRILGSNSAYQKASYQLPSGSTKIDETVAILEKSIEVVHDVKFHVEALAEYCKKDMMAKSRVVRQLQLAGIVPAKKKK